MPRAHLASVERANSIAIATDPSQLIPQCASKFPHQDSAGERTVMLKKYASKFTMDILPSVIATVIGAYIVNHYINKPAAPPVAAAISTVSPKNADELTAPAKPADSAAIDQAAAKSKAAADKAEKAEKAAADKAEKAADKAEKDKATASLPAEKRWHLPVLRDKTDKTAKAAPAAAAPAPVPAPAATASAAPPAAQNPVQEERRDANDLARAAIARLRATPDAPRGPEAAPVAVEASRAPEPLRVTPPPALQPLPPPVTVASPAIGEVYRAAPVTTGSTAPPTYQARATNESFRPTPPADIPLPPINLHADAAAESRPSVAEDVMSAAKSVFHAVVPR
jgi:hypothetical protein